MTKLIKSIIIASMGVIFFSANISADIIEGQKIYVKKLKSICGMTGGRFAAKHTQYEWDKIYQLGKMQEEIAKICHGIKIKKDLIPHIHDFVKNYASDSGNIPEC
jgi:hypothetical protein